MSSPYGPQPSAPPTYAEATKGVPPSSPYVPTCAFSKDPDFVTTVVPVGPNATHMICPYCRQEITSSTKTKPALIAYISGAFLCLLGCVCGCCLIPCCMDKCMNVQHKCPNCNAYLGTFKR